MTVPGLTEWDPALKEVYTKKEVACLAFGKNALLGVLPKERSGGKYFVQPVWTNAPGGGSASMAKAKTNGYGSKLNELNITRVPMFQRVAINGHLFASGQDSADTMIKVTKEFDSGFKNLSAQIDRRLFRSGTGVIGRVGGNTTVASTTIKVTDKADVFNVQIGDILRFAATDGGALRVGGTASGLAPVTGVSYTNGTITAGTADLSAEVGLVLGDYFYLDGDGADASTNLCMAGLEDWLPVNDRTTKLGTAFFGLTRSSNPERLGGIYIDGTQGNGDSNDIIIRLATEMGRHNAEPDIVFCPIDFFADLTRIWANIKKEWMNVSVAGKMGDLTISGLYPGIKAFVGGFILTIVPTRHCPSNRLYMLTRDTWTVRHAGDMIPCFALEMLGEPMMRLATWVSGQTDFEVESWLAGYANLGCEAPGLNGVAKLPAL